MTRSFLTGSFLFVLALATPSARAFDLCESYRTTAPLPDWFFDLCTPAGTSKSGAGGAFSSIGAPIHLNPATIPAFNTPIGFESIYSFQGGKEPKKNFALMKGISFFGVGLNTQSDNTFYGNSSSLANPKSLEAPSGGSASSVNIPTYDNASSTLNFAMSVSLAKLFPEDIENIVPNIGANVRYSTDRKDYSLGAGSALTLGRLTLSYGVVKDPETDLLPSKTVTTATAGLKFPRIQIEAVHVSSKSKQRSYTFVDAAGTSQTIQVESLDQKPMKMATLTTTVLGFQMTGAVRRYQDLLLHTYTEYHAAIQKRITPFVGIGYSYNYVPGYHSLSAQVMF